VDEYPLREDGGGCSTPPPSPRSFGQARGTVTVAWLNVALPLASVAE
jgi:hypothetical protein